MNSKNTTSYIIAKTYSTNKAPNKKTVRALKNAQEGKHLVKNENFEDFFQRFGT